MTHATAGSECESESDENDGPVACIASAGKTGRNSQLAVGHGEKNNRTFVMRGDKIGVFKHSEDGSLEYAATIKGLSFKKMDEFKPKHVSVKFLVRSLDSFLLLRCCCMTGIRK